MLKRGEKWQYLPKYGPTSRFYILTNALWCNSVCKLYNMSHKLSFDPWVNKHGDNINIPSSVKKHNGVSKLKREELLFVSKWSNNCPKQHRRAKTSNKKLSNLPFPIAILTVKIVYIRPLQPIPSYCQRKHEYISEKYWRRNPDTNKIPSSEKRV